MGLEVGESGATAEDKSIFCKYITCLKPSCSRFSQLAPVNSYPHSLFDPRFQRPLTLSPNFLFLQNLNQQIQSAKMSKSIVNTVQYPFKFESPIPEKGGKPGQITQTQLSLANVRGRIPSIQASRLRTMMLEANNDPNKILAHCCSYDGLSSRLVEEAGFPMIFLAGYPVSSAYGLPDTGYIACQEMCDTIQNVVRQVSVPVMADGDTGYGSPMNVKRTVECYALAGAAGIMIEDQTWPKSWFNSNFYIQDIANANERMRPHQGKGSRG